MAKIRARTRADGGVTYQVSWILGGGHKGPGGYESFLDRADAEQFRALVEASGEQWPHGWVKGVGFAEGQGSGTTVDEVYASWLDEQREKVALGRKTADSLQRDTRLWALHLQPTFGTRQFSTISRDEVKAWIRAQARKSAAKSVTNRHGLLSGIMSFGCVEMGLRADNPCAKQMLPRKHYDREIRFFTHGEWALLRRCLRSDVQLLCDVALHTGLRWGEITALQVGDIELMASNEDEDTVLTVHVVRAWKARKGEFDDSEVRLEQEETSKYKLGPTKNRQARWVQVAGELADRLVTSMQGKGQHDFVFTTTNDKPWRYAAFYERRWTPAVELAAEHGLDKKSTFHMLRHSFVVWLLADGEDIHVISARAGHQSVQFTIDRYGGLLNLHDASSARRMAKHQRDYVTSALLPGELTQQSVDARPIPRRQHPSDIKRGRKIS